MFTYVICVVSDINSPFRKRNVDLIYGKDKFGYRVLINQDEINFFQTTTIEEKH